jgi:Mg2+ and Co2+ transporter CorA
VAARWLDLVDPTREELLDVLPLQVDPEVVEALAAPAGDGHEPRPVLEAHGAYVFGVLLAARPVPEEDRIAYDEVDVVATPALVVTVRKSSSGGAPFDASALEHADDGGGDAGLLVHRLVDEVADTFLAALDATYGEIDELEDGMDDLRPAVVRERISALRHELLHSRRIASATRAGVRRVLDGRVDIGDHELFPAEIERLFSDTYETLVRVTEELDIARDLVAGVREHHQSKVAEAQGEVTKRLTVIASLVLVPSLIVGFFGQNFAEVFDDRYWTMGTSVFLIAASTALQLVLFRWRRWI